MATNETTIGPVIRWTNGTGSAVSSGGVVAVDGVLGVALVDIAIGASGAVQCGGRFTCPKVSAAVIAQGETLVWDSSAGEFDDKNATPAAGDVSGPTAWAAMAAGDGATTLEVVFTGVPGTVT